MKHLKAGLTALLIAAVGLLAGCASTNDAYYSALKADLEARSRVEVAKFEADRARLTAIAQIAATGGDSAKTAAVLALALHASPGTVSPQAPGTARGAAGITPGRTRAAVAGPRDGARVGVGGAAAARG